MQPEPLKYIPVRKSPEELAAERVAEIKEELELLGKADEWKEKFPERYEADVARLEKELSQLKVGKKEEKKEEKPKKKSKK